MYRPNISEVIRSSQLDSALYEIRKLNIPICNKEELTEQRKVLIILLIYRKGDKSRLF